MNCNILIALLVFSLSVYMNCSAKEENAPPAEEHKENIVMPIIPLEEKYCKNIQDKNDCAQIIEREQLKQLSQSENKNLINKQIKLNLKNGIKTIEEDSLKGSVHSFREYMPDLGYLVFYIQYLKGSAYSLISASSAKEFILNGIPILAPDKKKIVSTSFDLIEGVNPNSIQVWRISADDMSREMALDPQPINWGPSDALWIDNNTIHFTKNILTEDNLPACSINRMKLIFKENTWKILE